MTHQTFRTSVQHYPWRYQLLCLAPPAFILLWIRVEFGSGVDLILRFKEIHDASPNLTYFMDRATDNTSFFFYGIYALLLFWGLKTKNSSLVRFVVCFIAAQLAVTLLAVHCIKIIVGSPRPEMLLSGAVSSPFTLSSRYHSFPSGHTTEIVAAVSPLVFRFKNVFLSLLLGAIVAVIGFSRIYLAMHHIPDVAAGMVIGTVAGLLTFHLSCREPS